jgi:prepilin-type N-terminal cleavage/methylation domain-containing protein
LQKYSFKTRSFIAFHGMAIAELKYGELRLDSDGKMRNPKAGMTLIELMLVIVLMSTISICVPAYHNWLSLIRTNNALRGLSGDLRLARSMAVDRNHDVIVTFDVANNAYSIYSDTDGDGPDIYDLVKAVTLDSMGEGVIFGTTSLYAVGGGEITAPVYMSGTSDPVCVTMRANGEALNPGTIYLINRSDMSLSRRDRNRAIQIISTGNVRAYRWNGIGTNPWTLFY